MPDNEQEFSQEDKAFSEEDLRVFHSFQRSRTWQRICDALCQRRELLFREEPTDTGKLWENHGRLQEVNWLLHNGPLLMVQHERYRRSAAAAVYTAKHATSDAETSEIPQGPATYEG